MSAEAVDAKGLGVQATLTRRLGRVPGLKVARDLAVLAVDGVADTVRYAAHSGIGIRSTQGTLEARIIMEYHRLEKGLTLRRRRPWFGEQTVDKLLFLLELRGRRDPGDSDDHIVPAALGALGAYFEAFADAAEPSWVHLARFRFEALAAGRVVPATAGGIEPYSAEIDCRTASEFPKFVRARHSIRDFSSRSVPETSIAAAIALAATSPSVCNRQPTRVRRYRQAEDKRRILAHQNGNRGFGEDASEVLLITTDLASFVSAGERSQGLIDGGMFSMTLIYALHAQGVGTCCLNWSASTRQDLLLRKAAKIEPQERIVMLIAVGYPALDSFVATSTPTPSHRILIG